MSATDGAQSAPRELTEHTDRRDSCGRATQWSGSQYRIAHLSDPHLSRQFYREHIKSFKILLRRIVDEGFDHLVVSGDIVSTADPDDYYLAREIFQSHGLLDARRLTVVPGNHDIFGGPHRATDVLSFPSHIRSVDYGYRQSLFLQAFGELFEGTVRLQAGAPYPFLKKAGPFSLLGLNSIPPWSLGENPLGTNGRLSDAQCQSLEMFGRIEDSMPGIAVVVMHHHMNEFADDGTSTGMWKSIEARTMRMRKRRKVSRIFGQLGVQYVLHGHIHHNEVYARHDVTYLNGAGAVCDDPDEDLKFNTLIWDDASVRCSILRLGIPYQTSNVSKPLHRFGRPLSVPAVTSSF